MKTKFRSFVYLGLPVGVAIIFLLALFLALPGTAVVAAPEAPTNSTPLISEFEPNPAGTDPSDVSFELSGAPNAAFDLWILSVESDEGDPGVVDRATNVSGTFGTTGLAVVTIPDLENPSFTVIVADTFTGTVGTTDIDTDNDGIADDLSAIGTIRDAVGIPDNVGDEAFIYGAQLGGSDFSFVGSEPELVFRDASTGPFYAVDFTDAVYDIDATVLDAADFNADPTAPTFGSINPSLTSQLISEFEPNPAGTDPSDVSFELSGAPNAAFDLWILSVESDEGDPGVVDRATNVSGTFGTTGLAVVTIPDLENPSFTVIVADTFTGTVGTTDIDTDNDGIADDLSAIGTIRDAVGIPDNVGDEAFIYGAQLGGSDFSFVGSEPELVFRDASTGPFYAVDFTDAVYDIDATVLDAADFNADPTAPTFGSINPSLTSQLISEFEPNPAGTDPSDVSFELSGAPNAAFDLWILSVESDEGDPGVVDRATNVSGTFGTTGLAVVTIPDLENPSFTVIVADTFTGTVGTTDIDTDNDGIADDLSAIGTIRDAVGIPDNVGDEAFIYGAQLGGSDFSFVGSEPELVFRDASTGPFYAVDFTDAVYDIDATVLDAADFNADPTAPTFGSINPSYSGSTAGDLSVSKTGPSTTMAGENLLYEITISNQNLDPATDVVVTDTLPISTTYVSDDSGVTPTTPSAGEYVWDLGTVISGTQVTFNLTVTVDIAVPSATVLTNTVEVSTTAVGDDPANNSDEVLTTVIPDSSCGSPATRIHIIQGSGMSSPEIGNIHTIEAIVVGDFQTSDHLRGFFLQEDDANVDADPTTSEGIFVYDGSSPAVDVNEGDVVRVVGTVDEYYGLTQLGSVTSVEVCMASGIATPAIPTLPVTSVDDWEWYEGMSVNITETLYATDNYNQGRYGEVTLSIDGRLDTPTNVVEPGAAAIALQDLNDRSQIQLEDGRTSQNPIPPPYFAADGTLRAGDTLPGLAGVLHYAFDFYEIHPTETITFTRVNDREAAPPAVDGTHKVASFNVLNYFSTIDDSGAICGPSEDMDCRGADTADEFTRQRTKIITAVLTMDADVIGLMEIENHVADDAVLDLVSGLNAIAGAGTYAAIDTGAIGTDAIKVALLYKPAKVSPVGAYAILNSSVDATFLDTKNRPVLAQTFADVDTGVMFTVAVNHLKSKGSDCDDVSDPDTGDGQGNCNLTRTAAATALVNWLATDPTSSGDGAYLIIGDLNSYAMEDPIDAVKAGGYTDLLESLTNPYSYVFYGQAGYLDHALANSKMMAKVTGVTVWHINADEPSALDYNNYNQPELYNPDQYRAVRS